MLHFIMSELESFIQLMDQLRLGEVSGLRSIEVSNSAFFKRLRVLEHDVFLRLLQKVTKSLANSPRNQSWILELVPFANAVYAIDDTTLDALVRRTKALKPFSKGSMDTLGGRLGCALNLSTGLFAEIVFDQDARANEKNHIRPLVERLEAGSLYVFDLGYFSFPFFDYLTSHYCYFVSRLRTKTTFTVLQVLNDGPAYRDRIVHLGKYRADCTAYPVRLVDLFIDGVWYSYITNVLDPKLLPAVNVWTVYGQRWTIEKSFAAVKRALGMGFLHPCHENGMLIQIWSTLAVYQVLQDLRTQIASANGWDEDEVSWTNLMRRMSGYMGQPDLPQRRGHSLQSWLVAEAEHLFLKKRGVRKRRREKLPRAILDSCRRTRRPDLRQLEPRFARQGDVRPRKSVNDMLVAGLR